MEPNPGGGDGRPPARITASALTLVSDCRRRLWLQTHANGEASPVSAHVLVLRERSREHESAVAARFPGLLGPLWTRSGSFREAAESTARLLRESRAALRQAALLSPDGRRSAVAGFLYWDDGALVVLEARLAHRPETRFDFRLHLAHTRALLRESAGLEPARCEIVNGRGETVRAEPASEDDYEQALRKAVAVVAEAVEPDLLLAHSRCRSCAFYDHCWDRAEHEGRIEILPEVQSGHVGEFHALGVRTVTDMASFDPRRLHAPALRAAAKRAVLSARAWRDQAPVWLEPPALPRAPLVWFDLEGDSRGEEAETPIYLWGVAVEEAGGPRPETLLAPFGEGGDRAAWERFVARAMAIFDARPGTRWVHWDQSEALWIKRYTERYDAPPEFTARMRDGLFDLKRVLDRCLRLPLRSYSIKHVAPWMGFAWRNPDSGSEWSLAHYHRAKETGDAAERERLVREVAEYNEDDLLALRAIWRWIEANAPGR